MARRLVIYLIGVLVWPGPGFTLSADETVADVAARCHLPGDPPAFQASLRVEIEKKSGERTTQEFHYHWMQKDAEDVVGVVSVRTGNTTVRLQRRRQENTGKLMLDVVPASMAEWIENLVLFHPTDSGAYDFKMHNKVISGKQTSFMLARQGHAGQVNEPLGYAVINATDEAGRCRITRAVYAIAPHARAEKKVFFQWQEVDGQRVPKRIHVEDMHTLDRFIFSFSNILLE